MLRALDLTLETPEENLALDEALLLDCERGAGPEALRFWESPIYFVALGVSSRREADADTVLCARDNVPILRRASGGGTVLQGPGCLNFALVLRVDLRAELLDLTRSYAVILERVARALGGADLAHAGTSDLTLAGRKFSGNAQKRTRRALLHHGTILHGFDLARISRYLREPEKQPQYRRRRAHGDFIDNLPLAPQDIRRRLEREWAAEPAPTGVPPLPDLAPLLAERYTNPAWHERF